MKLTWKLTFLLVILRISFIFAKRYSLKWCVLNLHMIFGGLGVASLLSDYFLLGGESALCLTHSQSLISMFASIILRNFSSVSSALSVTLFVGSSTPDIIRHNLREYCFNLSTFIFSNSLVFVAIKLQDYASRSICSRLVTRLISLSILLS